MGVSRCFHNPNSHIPISVFYIIILYRGHRSMNSLLNSLCCYAAAQLNKKDRLEQNSLEGQSIAQCGFMKLWHSCWCWVAWQRQMCGGSRRNPRRQCRRVSASELKTNEPYKLYLTNPISQKKLCLLKIKNSLEYLVKSVNQAEGRFQRIEVIHICNTLSAEAKSH